MGKAKGNIVNWKQYNKALTQRGSITFWMDESAMKQWYNHTPTGRRGRSNTYSDTAISTALIIKNVFKLPLRALEGFINSVFQLMNVELKSPDYSSISKRAQTVAVNYRPRSRGPVRHIVIDSTGLKVFGEGEWKVRKHGKEKRRVWRKLHLAVDADTHEIVSMVASLDSVHDSEALPTLLNPLRRKIMHVSADGAYDTRNCYKVLKLKKMTPTIPPRKNVGYWEDGHPRNQAVNVLKTTHCQNGKTNLATMSGHYPRRLCIGINS